VEDNVAIGPDGGIRLNNYPAEWTVIG